MLEEAPLHNTLLGTLGTLVSRQQGRTVSDRMELVPRSIWLMLSLAEAVPSRHKMEPSKHGDWAVRRIHEQIPVVEHAAS